jgi:hypothetical protein
MKANSSLAEEITACERGLFSMEFCGYVQFEQIFVNILTKLFPPTRDIVRRKHVDLTKIQTLNFSSSLSSEHILR